MAALAEAAATEVAIPTELLNENTGEVAKTSGFLFREAVTPSLRTEADLVSISFNAQSPFQQVQVIETVPFGKTLVLDGKTQSARRDEFVYHECLVQPAMLACGWALGNPDHKPKRVYIGGGGELATAREILKYESIEEVIMVDLDQVVVEICKEKLPEWDAGSTDDPRLKVYYTDAHAWMNRTDEETGKFDLIVMDISDPIEAGPGIALYTQEFYQLAQRKLNPGGVLVTQSGPGGLLNHDECFCAVHSTLRSVFEHVCPLVAEVPSFGSPWAWNMAFDATGVEGSTLDEAAAQRCDREFIEQTAAQVDTRLAARLKPEAELRFYDGCAHRGIFGLSKPLKRSLAAEQRVITMDKPIFMY